MECLFFLHSQLRRKKNQNITFYPLPSFALFQAPALIQILDFFQHIIFGYTVSISNRKLIKTIEKKKQWTFSLLFCLDFDCFIYFISFHFFLKLVCFKGHSFYSFSLVRNSSMFTSLSLSSLLSPLQVNFEAIHFVNSIFFLFFNLF